MLNFAFRRREFFSVVDDVTDLIAQRVTISVIVASLTRSALHLMAPSVLYRKTPTFNFTKKVDITVLLNGSPHMVCNTI
ncbi:MAG: hypothetical protein K0S39_3182 [Paenibacillus sp.]|jgi:hypothetical protein|nr:hypothetical protein [Paenibacillus sp.]